MAGFRKAKAEQAAIKMGIYAAQGRGKTLTALLIAEGLAKLSGKRIAFVDTERGTDFYCKDVPERMVHPAAFDFDAIYTRSITDIIRDVKALNPAEHGVLIIDSVTHVWESAKAAWNGKTNKNGALPMYAWQQIKKPYKELMAILLSSPIHVIMCGREGTEFEEDEATGETKAVGKKMKAEGETPYEPHILINLYTDRDKNGNTEIYAYAEKDRSSKLAGRNIRIWPAEKSAFELLAVPVLSLLGHTQAKIESEDEHGSKDADALAAEEQQKTVHSAATLKRLAAQITLADSTAALKEIGGRITPDVKKGMVSSDVADLRALYQEREAELLRSGSKGEPAEKSPDPITETQEGESMLDVSDWSKFTEFMEGHAAAGHIGEAIFNATMAKLKTSDAGGARRQNTAARLRIATAVLVGKFDWTTGEILADTAKE